MKKALLLFTFVLLSSIALVSLVYVRFNSAVAGTSESLTYDGVYIDLIDQAKVDVLRANPEDEGLHIVKVDQNGYVPGVTLMENGTTEQYVSFDYQETELQLHFLDDVLVGCRKTASQELRELTGGRPIEAFSEETADSMKLYALGTLLENDSWVTDPQILKDVLADYSSQVQSYMGEM